MLNLKNLFCLINFISIVLYCISICSLSLQLKRYKYTVHCVQVHCLSSYQWGLTLNNNEHEISFETVTVYNQIICSRRRLKFKILRNFNNKIGLNTTANKLYHLNDLISFDILNFTFVHFKKFVIIQFLKYGKT